MMPTSSCSNTWLVVCTIGNRRLRVYEGTTNYFVFWGRWIGDQADGNHFFCRFGCCQHSAVLSVNACHHLLQVSCLPWSSYNTMHGASCRAIVHGGGCHASLCIPVHLRALHLPGGIGKMAWPLCRPDTLGCIVVRIVEQAANGTRHKIFVNVSPKRSGQTKPFGCGMNPLKHLISLWPWMLNG
jgi:hypothetical protein